MNSMYTDGFTCRVMFSRRRVPENALNNVKLEITDFNTKEIEEYFRPITVDPGRRDAFNSYHGDNDLRRLTTKEYYAASGAPGRLKQQDKQKQQNGLKSLETSIPTWKTTREDKLISHIAHMLMNFQTFADFYGFNSAKSNWNNYRGRQRALDNCTNILINGSKKYNKMKRKKKKTNFNRRKRKKMNNRRNYGIDIPFTEK